MTSESHVKGGTQSYSENYYFFRKGANERRDWRIHAALAQRLITQARTLYVDEELGLDLTNTVYALDSTTIALCLSVFEPRRFFSSRSTNS